MEDLESVLNEFEKIPCDVKSASVFDVAGYPHYENVASNILAFFLDPAKEHGLGSLVLDSLLEARCCEPQDHGVVMVSREFSTKARGRLDILIESESQVIGIENKIFHRLANDFQDYGSTIDGIAKNGGKTSVKIILCIRGKRKEESSPNNFHCVTYRDLFLKIKGNLGKYATSGSQKWLLYLLDFIQSIEAIAGGNMDFDAKDRFFMENDGRVDAFLKARNSFNAKLNRKTVGLAEMVEEPATCEKKWIFAKNCLVLDFDIAGHAISFDFYIGPTLCQLQLFGRNEEARTYLDTLIKEAGITYIKRKGERYILQELDVLTDNMKLKEVFQAEIKKLIDPEILRKP